MRERLRAALPYALIILIGMSCVVVIALTAVGSLRTGWLADANMQSKLAADYNIQPTFTLVAVDATRIARLRATDEAALQGTPNLTTLATVAIGQVTPGGTHVAQVTHTPTPSATPTPTFTPLPTHTPTTTPTPRPTRTRTPTPIVTVIRTPNTPTPTYTSPPPPPSNTRVPPSPTSVLPPRDTWTPTNTPTPTNTSTDTPSPTINAPPPPPLSLMVVNTSTTLISLAWSDESRADPDFAWYRVLRGATSGGPYTLQFTTTTNTWIDPGLSAGTTYYYVVQAQDSAAQLSGDSPEASGTTGPPVVPNPTPDCAAPGSPTDCTNAGGPPDGNYSSVNPGEQLILDLGPNNGILDGPGYDFVYYERAVAPPPSYRSIQMDAVIVELSTDRVTWYAAFAWQLGNEAAAQNSNIRDYAISGGLNPDVNFCDLSLGASPNELIPMVAGGDGSCSSALGLYGTLPIQTGIAIDINGVVPPPTGQGYRYVRIQGIAPNPPAEVDGIERLN